MNHNSHRARRNITYYKTIVLAQQRKVSETIIMHPMQYEEHKCNKSSSVLLSTGRGGTSST